MVYQVSEKQCHPVPAALVCVKLTTGQFSMVECSPEISACANERACEAGKGLGINYRAEAGMREKVLVCNKLTTTPKLGELLIERQLWSYPVSILLQKRLVCRSYKRVLSVKDVFVSLPTGFGKSYCPCKAAPAVVCVP